MYNTSCEEYQIEGSFVNRSCNMFGAKKEAVAGIRSKVDSSANVVAGIDFFFFFNQAWMAFAMGLVLEQFHGDNYADDDGSSVDVDPTNQYSIVLLRFVYIS
ncbi:unnamed protein product [Fraxinus pennsylvanica]|uniref:Uncharacterized protein n=1 Tax=Fraxinus pennsylvanica TaxID=56036 RepID=A0AAD1ZKZ9_9LAMI|nr:unnamed protein product [Fraxinus pennsylvanica]